MSLRIGIDIGGTFTDLVAIAPDGTVRTHKTASTPHDYSQGIATGLAALLTGEAVAEVLHATTVGSNTILEGKGARTALITTAGFRDVLEIRDLRMPRLYDMHWTKPPALVERRLRLEVSEKTRPDGSIAVPLDPASIAACIERIRAEGVQSVAICLLHSYANPAHERAVADALRAALPDVALSVSHEILPEIKEYPRTSTTVVNAYVQPVVRAYLTALSARLRALGITAPLHLMQSNGGLAAAGHAAAFPAHIVESGPAAGVVGAAALAARLQEDRLITFDMGGTTAKAGLVEDGHVLRTEAMEVGAGVMAGARLLVGAGYMLKLPAIDLAEVGAGGGSICRLDAAGAPKVGPHSAGADPGPVCYGRGGTEPTITDCNLVLGYLDPAGLAGGAVKLDREAALHAVTDHIAAPLGLPLEQAAHGMLRLAAATMMRAIRAVSVERGRDVRGFSLLAFGGNGPLFAAGIAAELGIRRVIVPPMPGLFSAFGLLLADTEHHATRSLRMRTADPAALQTALDALLQEGADRLAEDGFPPDRRSATRTARARYVGQSSELSVPLPDGDAPAILAALPEAFAAEHARTYGFRAPPGEPVELMGLSVIARGIPEHPRLPARIPPATATVPPCRRAWFEATGWTDTPVLARAGLATTPRQGPLIVQEYDATCLVPPGASAALDAFGNVRIELQ
ncbi:hydantoinase/oxoprolinase family protein [Limobrevibacterium gyesilva]|uniref:Hydantoinase/oxoprolinase family protein n=1 Tax=Limobrevibacterium gyesilva TaxID=2991712 RepID=A0AA41YP46_9PROT|nr:hydantoinase/oxoprolinase family protein [Limobrevibacterium gyesilva]MCW3477129.1 hydantoinase/oxoprolinase family protein [Limobrevibacterium gyesilva]